ncbi:MAG TPA: tyrosine-type recombinase/integrase [Sphingobium sp.]|uniref:tyrosine-type recombinase/integrase n=1 Tax=Sphingobium sp. TaxID=1912891 RepID=UPI002ED3CC8F
MSAVTNIFRRGAIYYWRKRLRWPDDAILAISMSLRTARLRVARYRATRLAAFVERTLGEEAGMAIQPGLSVQRRDAFIKRQALTELARLVALDHQVTRFEASPEGGVNEDFDEILVNMIRMSEAGKCYPLPIGGNEEDLELYEGRFFHPHLSPYSDSRFAEQRPPDALQEYRLVAKAALDQLGVAVTDDNMQTVLQALFSAKNEALQRYRKARRAGAPPPVAGDDTPCWAFSGEWPYLYLYDFGLARGSVAPVKPESVAPDWKTVTVVEAAECYLEDVVPKPPEEGDWGSIKRQTNQKWDDRSVRSFRSAAMLLGKVHGGAIVELTQRHIERLEYAFDHLPQSHHKSDRHAAMALDEIIEETRLRLESEEIDKESIGLKIPTTNKHITFLNVLIKWVENKSGISLNLTMERKVDPRSKSKLRDAYDIAEVEKMFSLPPWTGCFSEKNRFEPGDRIFHDALYWVFIMAWYHGFRREEMCGIALVDVILDKGIPHISTRLGKTKTSVRVTPLHPELLRLGFVNYIDELKRRGHEYLFPELNGFKSTSGDIFGKRHYGPLNEMLRLGEGKRLHSLRHSTATELADTSASEIAIAE